MSVSPAPVPAAPSPLAHLTRRRKAALVVQLLISDGNKLALSSLPEAVQAELAQELGKIRLVDRDTVNAVAEEFAGILASIGLSAPGGASAALAALSEHISPALARKLQAELDAQKGSDPWPRIASLELDQLLPIFQAESVEVGAIVLSKLTVERAAEVLGGLPGDQARRITFAVSQTETATPSAIARIGEALVQDYCQTKEVAFEKPPVDRIGAILNSSPASTRDDLLDGLEGSDADLAKSVRKAIFTFADIPARMQPTDIPAALRSVDPDDLNTAIAFALASDGPLNDSAEHVLANISQRMAGQMREDAEEMGKVSTKVGEAAMNKVTAAIRALADAGTIKLMSPDEEGDEAEAA
ncbi:FliG C-terminal domain-containing protein [Yoonia sp. R2331]|uniref:FliG C-terminal domain-containing protein n=1 Tax=Yoonia sp. R2331 TaxID=3237238 RepID=UPI0034E3A3FA